MMKKTFYTLFILAAIGVNARAQGLQRLPSGVQCQIVKQTAGDKIKQNDVVTFNVEQRTDKDSLLFSSFKAGQAVKMQVQPSRNVGDLMDVMPLLAAGDSALIKVPIDSIFKGHEDQRPAFLAAGGSINYKVKIEKVQSLADAMAERNAALAKIKAAEATQGDTYIKEHKLAVKTTPSGLRYVITNAGNGIKPLTGDTVKVNYAGRTVDGKLFDTSIKSVAAAAGQENPNRPYEPIAFPVGTSRVIKGWDEGLLLLNEGSKATFIIPSSLGYGEQGSGAIAPYSTLVFDVELVKVIRGKHLAAKTGAKPAVKSKTAVAKKRTVVKKKIN